MRPFYSGASFDNYIGTKKTLSNLINATRFERRKKIYYLTATKNI